MKWYVITGRVPNEEDTMAVFEAEDADDARRQFGELLWDPGQYAGTTIAEFDARWGSVHGVYVTGIAEFDVKIRIIG